tara:strand:- start:38453 stop:38776 length:324 start_codon:yes stop_codon:yes gene_type:complete
MKVSKVSDEEIETLFTTVFDDKVATYNNISEFEAKCQRQVGKDDITIEVMICGTAGSPTVDDWKTGNIENAETVTIDRFDVGELTLTLDPEETLYLNPNDYYVFYKS